MNLKQAFANKLLDRFEMMTLAEKLADLNQHGKHISSFDDIDFHDGQFVFSNLVDVKKKDVLFYLSMLLSAFLTLSDKRLTSIFMNHPFLPIHFYEKWLICPQTDFLHHPPSILHSANAGTQPYRKNIFHSTSPVNNICTV